MNDKTQKDVKSWRLILLVIILFAAIITTVTVAYVVTDKPVLQAESPESGGLVFDENAVSGGWEEMSQEEVEAALNAKLEEGLINISMNTSPFFEDGVSEGNLMIVNETMNNYPQMVQIIRNDTEECIYTSKAIPVGSKIERAALDVDLDAGVYQCTALFHNLDDSGNIIGTAGVIINVTIKN